MYRTVQKKKEICAGFYAGPQIAKDMDLLLQYIIIIVY